MLIGIDVGTQSLKVSITSPTLEVKAIASTSYQVEFPAPNCAEQNPRLWERAIGPTIAEALKIAGISPFNVSAVGVCGQLDGCIPVDTRGRALGACLIWMDRRAQAELVGLDRHYLRQVTGVVPDPSHFAAKVKWLKQNRTDRRCGIRYHQPVSYLVERLTGENVIDHALASTSMVYGLRSQRYEPDLLTRFGIEESELPIIARAQDRAGALTAIGSALTGLPSGVPVAVGTGDDFSTVLGAGLKPVEQVSVAVGTGEVVGSLLPGPVIDERALLETHPYPSGNWFIENPGWVSGGSVKWLSSLLNVADWTTFDELASKAPSGCSGLTFIPALSGAMSPEWVPEMKGCFYGLTAAHTASHMARAVLEGCSFAMRDVIDRLCELGAKPTMIKLLAGGAHSELWGQIRADISGLPVHLPQHAHSSPIGAAMLAGTAAQIFRDLSEADGLLPTPRKELQRDPANMAALESAYQRYRSLFEALKSLHPHEATTAGVI